MYSEKDGSPVSKPEMTFDEQWITPAVKLSHQLLREKVPGAAFDGEPFMGTSVFEWRGESLIATMCFYHTVLFFSHNGTAHAAVYTRDEGNMVPWVDGLPDFAYFEKVIKLPELRFASFVGETNRHLSDVERIHAQSRPSLESKDAEIH